MPRLMRRYVVLSTILLALALPAVAQMPGLPIKGVLDKASDRALGKLAKPGAFAADNVVRISWPAPADAMGHAGGT